MKSTLGAIIIALICPLTLLAQSNYKPGYVVNVQGDTLKGFINYREWSRNPTQISFKSNLSDAQDKDVNVKNTNAFAVTGFEYYERYIVKVSTDSLDINYLHTKADNKFIIDTVFLRVITKGTHVSLYSYTDAIKQRFYISQKSNHDEPDELVYHAYYNADQQTMQYISRYRVQLQNIAQSNGVSLTIPISQARYDERDLVGIVSKINGSTAGQFMSAKISGIRWFAGISISDNIMKFDGNIQTGNGSNISPRLSAGIDFLPNKNVQRLVLRAQLSVTTDRHKFSSKSALYNNGTITQINFNQYTVSIQPQAIYNFYATDKTNLFVGAGIGFNISSYPNTYSVLRNLSNSIKLYGYPEYSHVWITIPIKAGVLINRNLELYTSYMPPTSFNTENEFSATISSVSAGVNFYFGQK